MSTLAVKYAPTVIDVTVEATKLHVVLADGRELTAPLEWFPRLRDAKALARRNWRLIGQGEGIHWPDIEQK